MLEREIEAYLTQMAKHYPSMLCEKFKSPMRRYVPDRIISYMGKTYFIELKKPGEKPNPGQVRDHERRLYAGFIVQVLDSKEKVDSFFNKINHRRMKLALQ